MLIYTKIDIIKQLNVYINFKIEVSKIRKAEFMLIKKKLPLLIIILISLPLIILTIVYYSYISKQLLWENKDKMQQVLTMESEYLDAYLETRLLEVHYLANNREVSHFLDVFHSLPNNSDPNFRMNNKEMNLYFTDLNKERTELSDIFLISPSGTVLAGNNPRSYWISLSERPYFKSAMAGKETISSLIKDKVDGQYVIIAASPIWSDDGKEVLGVMAAIIDMGNTSDGIRRLVDPDIGNAYLIDSEGTIIFHSDKLLNATVPKYIEIQRFFTYNMLLPQSGSEVFQTIDGKKFILYKRIPNTTWNLIIEQDVHVLMNSAYRALYVILILGIITLGIALLISMHFVRTITEPLTELTTVMNATANGDLISRVHYQSKNEFGQLSQNFNSMLDELAGTYEEISAKNDELIAAEEELRINYEELSKVQYQVQVTQEKYNLALESARDIIWEWDLCDHSFFASEQWSTLTGTTAPSPKIQEIVFENLLSDTDAKRMAQQIDELLHHNYEHLSIDFESVVSPTDIKWFQAKFSAVFDATGKALKISGTLADITYQKLAEEQIRKLAFTDQLTGLPNRTSCMMKLTEEIEQNAQNQEAIAILMLDIDNFKRVNDTLGHKAGDQLLMDVSKRLEALNYPVYRFSGDEFVLCITDISDPSLISQYVDTVVSQFSTPFHLTGKVLNISVAIGISLFPNDGLTVEKLLQNADTAMFLAKASGKSKVEYFAEFMSEHILKKIEIEEILRRAVNDHLLVMYFQPQHEVQTRKLIGFEALMRVILEDGTIISPKDFIPVAEETGLIVELGEWALNHVFSKISEWQQNHYHFGHVSVNVSEIQLKKPGFASLAKQIAEEANIEPSFVELEITESILMEELDATIQTLSELREMGYQIALDDFGTGYSSFNYLRTIPLTCLKIDKSFIDNIESNKKAESLVRQIIEIAHDMDLKVVAEGVENQDQYNVLSITSCDFIQGYYFSKPLPLTIVENLLKSTN